MANSNELNEEQKRELLKSEYNSCDTGYNSRDSIIPQEMIGLIALFGGLAAVFKYITDAMLPVPAKIVALIVIFLVGLAALLALHVDMASNISCKRVLRQRMEKIYEALSNIERLNELELKGIWASISDRLRLWDEKLKRLWSKNSIVGSSNQGYASFGRSDIESEAPFFLWVGRLAVLAWVFLCIAIISGTIIDP